MKIQISEPMHSAEAVCVVVEGFCNHAKADYEDRDFIKDTFWADAGIYVPDDTTTESVLTCQRCGAWHDGDGWRDA